jgi:hypothetical protein
MAVSKRGKKGNNENAPSSSTSAETTTTSTAHIPEDTSPGVINGLSPPQFTMLVCISLAFTHLLDSARALNAAKDLFQNGIIASENATALSTIVNATSFCVRHYYHPNVTEALTGTNGSMDMEEILSEFACTTSDMSIINIKYQTSLLRIALCAATSLLCWGDVPLLKSWSFAYGTFIITSIASYLYTKDDLKGTEKYSLFAMIVLILTSNYKGRQGRLRIQIDEGMYSLVLFFIVVFMSYMISTHLVFGIEDFTYLNIEDVTSGGKAVWFINVVVEYSILMIVSAFALFYFDEGRKRVSFSCFICVYVCVHSYIIIIILKHFSLLLLLFMMLLLFYNFHTSYK